MHRLHSGLTIVVPIKKGKSATLRSLLQEINASIGLSKKTGHDLADRSINSSQLRAESEDPEMDALQTIGDPKGAKMIDNLQVVETATNHIITVNQQLKTPNPIAKTNVEVLERIAVGSAAISDMKSTKQALLCDFDSAETVLFVSGVIIPAQQYQNQVLPETLIFATAYCGSLSNHLGDLMQTCRAGLCEIFRHCQGFPDDGIIQDQALIRYIKNHRQAAAFNSRYSCITKSDVQKEKDLRVEIQNFVESIPTTGSTKTQDALPIRNLIQEHIKKPGSKYNWAVKPAKLNITELTAKNRIIIFPLLIALIIIAITVIVNPDSLGWFLSIGLGVAMIIDLVVVIYLLVKAMMYAISRNKTETAQRPPDEYVRTITATQLRPVINEMTAAAPLKSGFLRKHFYHAALRVVNFGRSHLMNVPTVSSLRWLSIDKKRRLLFLSNYSNTTDFYVREFLTGNTPRGVNFMFTNGQGFPDADMLTKGGISKDPEGYMNVIHTHQHVTDLWYAHDFNLTVDQILRNRKLRNGLYKDMNETEAAKWLKLI